VVRVLLWIGLGLVAVPLVGWSALVMFHCVPAPQPLRLLLAVAVPVVVIAAMVRRASVRRTGVAAAGAFALGLGVFWAQAASNDRSWSPDVARLPWAEFRGDMVTVHDIRSCRYRSQTDYDVAWRSDTFDLSRLRGVDLFHVFWGSPSIAHTMLSFGFDDGRQLCLSVETRREQGETYDAVKGFFRQYELIYVFGDETDLVKLRTNFRGEQVYLYPLRVPVDKVRQVLVDYLQAATELRERPEWYNALTENCTTTLLGQALPVINPDASLDWRMVVNGRLHELLYERGRIDTSLPLEELRRRSLVNDRARSADDDANFSRRIRQP
jgi:hypothetical protein